MSRIQRSALVQHGAEHMYALVNDVSSYPAFLPWCAGASVLEQTATSMTARILIQRGGIGTAFVTCNRMSPGQSIEMSLQEGPFSALRGLWLFQPLADNACKVSLDLQFEIANPLLRATVGRLFEQVAGTMVDAFCQRADQVSTSGTTDLQKGTCAHSKH